MNARTRRRVAAGGALVALVALPTLTAASLARMALITYVATVTIVAGAAWAREVDLELRLRKQANDLDVARTAYRRLLARNGMIERENEQLRGGPR